MTTTDLLTTKESAAVLRVSEQTLRRYVKQGLVPRLAVNRRVHRYRRRDIEALLNGEGAAANGAFVNPSSATDARHDLHSQ
jgi:predicted site-specific integrase-resolvase